MNPDELKTGGILANSDLASDIGAAGFDTLLALWPRVMSGALVTPESQAKMKAAYAKDVAILPDTTVASLINAAGFDNPTLFFQAGLIHGWFASRQASGVCLSG